LLSCVIDGLFAASISICHEINHNTAMLILNTINDIGKLNSQGCTILLICRILDKLDVRATLLTQGENST
jgi:hypothetical protein